MEKFIVIPFTAGLLITNINIDSPSISKYTATKLMFGIDVNIIDEMLKINYDCLSYIRVRIEVASFVDFEERSKLVENKDYWFYLITL